MPENGILGALHFDWVSIFVLRKLFISIVLACLSGFAGAAEGPLHGSGEPAGVLPASAAEGALHGDVQPVAQAVASEKDFFAARKAYNAGDAGQLNRLASHFSFSLLEPYIAYYRLQVNLEKADVADIRKFLARPDNTPLIDNLRAEWLRLLGKNQQWEAFLEEYPRLVNSDDELDCYALQARIQTGETGALSESRQLWLDGDKLPENCTPLFDAAIAAGAISEQDIWQRFRLALEAGNVSLAGRVASRLPAREAPDPLALRSAYRHPSRYLASLKLHDAPMATRAVALFALQRLATHSTQQAFAAWERVAAYFPDAEQRYFYGWLGYEGSRAHDDRALQWYQQAGNVQLNPDQLAWRVRAALRELNWRAVLSSINAMDADQQSIPAWRYWKGRALEALGLQDVARPIFTALSDDYGFYSLLAADELSDSVATAAEAASHLPNQAEIDEVLKRPGIQRALALYRMNLYADASNEWDWAVRNFTDRQLLAAAEVARRNRIFDEAIDTAERTEQVHDLQLRYPTPYRAELEQHIQENDLNEAWVYGLMRQESRFATHAKSNVGAAGLMQIMPSTARWVAHRLGIRYRKGRIHELGTNLKLGTYYLRTVLSRFHNNPVLAFAAYNAGPTRAQKWRGDAPLEGAIYIETIPFSETRHYVRKVMSNTVYYSRLFGQPASLKNRLGTIKPTKAARHVITNG